jgi:hypothetical protein
MEPLRIGAGQSTSYVHSRDFCRFGGEIKPFDIAAVAPTLAVADG